MPSPVAIAARSRLEPGDLAAIVRLHGREAAEHGLDASFEVEVARGLTDLAIAWTRSPDAGRVWLAGPPEDPLGSIAVIRERADLARLRWFMVAPDARRRGLGRRLLDEALAYVRARGFSAVELGTFSELTVAAAMYTRAGFQLVESARVEQWGRWIEARKYRLSLPPAAIQPRSMMTSMLDLSAIAEERIRAAGETLGRAFSEDPLCAYTQPDLEARIAQFTWLFTQLIREAARRGGACAAVRREQLDAVAVWTPPMPKAPPNKDAAASEIDQMQQRFGPGACHRFTTAYRHFEHVHQRCMPRPHWYLALLGVSPERQGQGIGRELLTAGLRRADQQHLPCYLETFVQKNVPLYERSGFRVVEAGIEPHSQIAFWAMKRKPAA